MTTDSPVHTDLERALEAVLVRYGLPAYPDDHWWPDTADRGDLTSDLARAARDYFTEALNAVSLVPCRECGQGPATNVLVGVPVCPDCFERLLPPSTSPIHAAYQEEPHP